MLLISFFQELQIRLAVCSTSNFQELIVNRSHTFLAKQVSHQKLLVET
jgi:hypothetical protein